MTVNALAARGLARQPSLADQVYDLLFDRIVTLDLPPGAKISEAEISAQAGVSRQPVRDAFYRLSQMGLVVIRPQRATVVAPLSQDAMLRAQFVRQALEAETAGLAAGFASDESAASLSEVVARQRRAVDAGDAVEFHRLDDAFHRGICDLAGQGHVWDLIRDNKAHMDRIRVLTISFSAAQSIRDHEDIIAALGRGDSEGAASLMRLHLSRIRADVARVRAEHSGLFGQE